MTDAVSFDPLLTQAADYLQRKAESARGTVCDDDKADGLFAMASAVRSMVGVILCPEPTAHWQDHPHLTGEQK